MKSDRADAAGYGGGKAPTGNSASAAKGDSVGSSSFGHKGFSAANAPKSDVRAELGRVMDRIHGIAKAIANPITGRQSSNVEVVQGTRSMPTAVQRELTEAYMRGHNKIGGTGLGTTDLRGFGVLADIPGQLHQWQPSAKKGALNPGPGGTTRMSTMQTSPSPGWMTGQPQDSTRFDMGAPIGPRSMSYPTAVGRSDQFRSSYDTQLR